MAGLAREHRVYAPDLLGFGLAPKPPAPYTPERWAEQIAGLRDYANLDRMVLAGHSLGGMVALTVTRQAPARVAGLGLLNALGIGAHPVARLANGLPSPLVRLLHRPGIGERLFFALRGNQMMARGLALGAYADRASAPPDALEAWLTLIHQPGAEHAYLDVVRRLHTYVVDLAPGELTMPALILWGAEDRGLPVRIAGDAQRLLPQAQQIIIPRCGHVPHMERPAAVQAALTDLVAASQN
jgi:pimeloyl-ACP methyl ester carboxylesterase